MKTFILFFVTLSLFIEPIAAQLISENGSYTVQFGDSLKVKLYRATEDIGAGIKAYYYAPTNLRLVENEEGQPEFMLMSYHIAEKDEAIMHWLLKWGITASQQRMLDSFMLVKIDSTARLLGAINVTPDAKLRFLNKGKNQGLTDILEQCMTSGGTVPTHADAKSASSFKCSGESAKILLNAFKDSTKCKDIFIQMGFSYDILFTQRDGLTQVVSKRLVLELSLEAIFQKAKKCSECIVRMKDE